MKPKTNLALETTDSSPFKGNAALEYSAIRSRLTEVLERSGGFEAGIDGLYVDQVASNTIFLRKADNFLMSNKANEYTFVRVADAKVKLAKIIDNALNQLAISRRNRLINQTEAGLMTELREAILRGSHDPE